jgi:PAS domain S-box-containing protein
MPADATAGSSPSVSDLQRRVDELAAELRARSADYQEALLREAAVDEVLRVINSSSGGLVPVFDAMLERATALCEATFGVLWTYDGEHMHAAAILGATPKYTDFLRAGLHPPSPVAHQPLLRGAQVVHIPDVSAHEGYRSGVALPNALVDLGGVRTLLAVALRKDAKFLGVFSIYRNQVRPFSDKQIALLQNFAAQAVVAMENARLMGELRERTDELSESLKLQTATADVLKVISRSTFDLKSVLHTLVESAARLCEADKGTITRLKDGAFYREEAYGFSPEFTDYVKELPVVPGRSDGTARALQEARTIHIADVQADPDFTFYEGQRLGGFRTVLAVPMLREGQPIGAMALTRSEVRPFTDKQIEMVSTFADQAVIAIENARLITETREALEQQTATADVLEVINSSPGHVEPVFDAILEKSMVLCQAAFGLLNVYDGQRFHTAATRGVPAKFDEYRRSSPADYGPTTAPAQLVAGESYVHSIDAAAEEAYKSGDPNRRALVDLGGARTVLVMALRKDDALLGMVAIYRQEVRPFSEKQIALLQDFAAQAVIAMENARLLNELRQRTRDLQESFEYQGASSAVLNVISRSPTDAQPVFMAIAESAARLCQAEYCHVFGYDGELIHFMASHGQSPKAQETIRRLYPKSPGQGSCAARAILNGTVEQVPDVRADPEYTHGEVAEVMKINSIVAVPMLKDGRPVGAISLLRAAPGDFPQRQVELLQTFADQAVIAINNVGLFDEVQARARDLQESLEYQTATSDVLKVISRSTFDLQAVLDTLSTSAARLCAAELSFMTRRDGDAFRFVTAVGSTPETTRDARQLKQDFLDHRIFRAGRESITGRVVAEGRVVQIVDVATDPDYALSEINTIGKIQTLLGVPLVREGTVIGTMSLGRQRIEPFTSKQIELVRTFADQAVIAIENARLLTEQREALEQQTANADVLQVINASPGNLAPVFEAILEKAMHVCRASFGGLWTFEADRYVVAALHNVPKAYANFLRTTTVVPGPGSAPYRFLHGERSVIQNIDLAAEEPYRAGDPQRRALVELGGARSALQVPLCKDDTVIGVVTIYRQEVREFDERQIALLQSFAAQAVIAIQNARLLSELRASLEQQTATSDVLRTISSSSVDLESVLDTLVETVARLCRADLAYMFRQEDELYHLVATHGLSDEAQAFVVAHPIAPEDRRTVSGRVALERRTVHIADVLEDPDYSYGGQQIAGYRTILGIPLLRENMLVGIFNVARTRVEPFTDKEIELATSFADQAVIAIENARLFEELRDRQAELRVTFDNMGDGVAMFDAEPRLAAWNRNFETIIGLPEARLAERPSYANYLRLLAQRGEFGTENVEAELASRLENTDRELRLERTRADGTVIEVRRNAVPSGGFVLIYSDITERRRAEAAIRAARDAAEAALERQTATADILKVIASSPTDVEPVLAAVVKAAVRFCGATDAMIQLRDGDSVMSRAHEGPLTYNANDRRSLDRSTAGGRAIVDAGTCHLPDIEALNPAEFVTARRLAALHGFRAIVAAPLKREDIAIGAVVLRKVEPGPFTLQQIALLETFAAQAVIAIENVRLFTELKDSLERLKAAQANLIQSEKMASLGQLTAGIAHEIKNPLNFVNNFAGLSVELLGELKAAAQPALAAMSEDARAEFGETIEMITSNLGKIAEHGRRADGIVKSMLSHSRGGTGDWQESDINALIEEALNLAYHGARAQDKEFNVTLERDFALGTQPIELVPQDVTRVFLNLFGNGFYAANKRRLGGGEAGYRPTLKVSTRDLGEAVEITVRDNGIGIPPQVRAKLFQPFFTTKPTGEGTGLGLSISYDIVTQQHGGTIEVESEPGAFTEFTVRLPRRWRAGSARRT